MAVKITPVLIDQIVECIQENVGRPPKICAAKFGVPGSTFDRWMKLGAEEDCKEPAYARLYEEVNSASASKQLELIDTIGKHGTADWKAAERILIGLNPDLDVKKSVQKIEIDSTVKNQYQIEVGVPQIVDLVRLFGELASSYSVTGAAREVAGTVGSIDAGSVIDVFEVDDSEVE